MRSRRAAALTGILAIAGGCVALHHLVGGGQETLRFDHRDHAARGIACATCHDTLADAPRANHPACAPCHSVSENCTLCHAATPAATSQAAAGDLRFSHRRHELRDVPCTRCHDGIADARRLDPTAYRPSMQSCLECHRGLGAPALACPVCHEHTTGATRPASHDPGWIAHHGAESREQAASCGACHAAADCVRCHQEMPPRNHTEFFLRRGHGLESRWDRERCLACHREDSCTECHRVTPPTNHGPGWAAPTYHHCQACHFPLEDTSCAVCHARAHPTGVPFPTR